MARRVEVGSTKKLVPGTRMMVQVDDRSIALFNVDDTVYAIDDTCVHQGQSLSMGRVDGLIVTCPGHGLRFDLTTGLVSPGYGVASYPVTVVEHAIFVEIPAEEEKGAT